MKPRTLLTRLCHRWGFRGGGAQRCGGKNERLDVPGSLSRSLEIAVCSLEEELTGRGHRVHAVLGHRHDSLWMDEGLEAWFQAALRWQISRLSAGCTLELRSFEAAGRAVIKVWAPGPARRPQIALPRPPAGIEYWVEAPPAVAVACSFACREVRLSAEEPRAVSVFGV